MAQFVAFESDVEVNGRTVYAIVDGMGTFRQYAEAILQQHGIDDLKADDWYSQQAWLDAFKTISERIGEKTLYAIGRKIPENAEFPDQIKTIEQALAAIDVAYHMNHRRGERILYDAANDEMLPGIGHYHFESGGEKQARVVCDNPYPCDFDRGIIAAMAERFKPALAVWVRVEHDPDGPCRKKGADSCTYVVRW